MVDLEIETLLFVAAVANGSGAIDADAGRQGHAFRALHQRNTAFIIPNPWDAGTARLLAYLGFEALATTSRHERGTPR